MTTDLDRAALRRELLDLAGGAVVCRQLDVHGIRTSYLEAGEGPTLVLLHGADGGAINWFRVIAPLSRSFRVLAPDIPGYGESEKPAGAAYDRPFFADWLEAFLESAGVASAALVGSSQGGAIALSLALRAPARVERLVLVGAAGLGDFSILANLPGFLSMLSQSIVPTDAMVRWTAHYLVDDESCLPDALARYFVAVLRSGGTRVFWNGRGRAVARFAAAELASVSMPTLLLWGEDDRVFPLAWAERAAGELADARLVRLPGSRHLPHLDRPDEVVAAIREFCAERARGAQAS